MIPDDSKCLQMIPDDSRWLQMTRWLQMIPDDSRCLQIIPDASRCLRWLQMTPDDSRWLQIPPDDSTCLQMIPNDSRWFQMTPDGSRCLQQWSQLGNLWIPPSMYLKKSCLGSRAGVICIYVYSYTIVLLCIELDSNTSYTSMICKGMYHAQHFTPLCAREPAELRPAFAL